MDEKSYNLLKNGGFCVIMYKMVVVNMQNPNALIAMAHVSLNANNPYTVFAEFFKYCIYVNASDVMMVEEAINAVGTEFGLFVPYHIAMKCLSQLGHEGAVFLDGHIIQRTGTFDTESFDERRHKYREIETALINALIRYVARYGRDWSSDYAREQLIRVLDKNCLAYDIFSHGSKVAFDDSLAADETTEEEVITAEEIGEADGSEDQPLFRDSLLAGKFVQSLLGSGMEEEDYLKQICEGLMVCVGAYQLPSAEGANAHPAINGTAFFFDTRLLLRLLGCAGEAAVAATNELVKLIQDGGGLVCYYPHTRDEIVRAFDDAIQLLERGYPPRDNEMRLYAASIKNSTTIMKAKRASVSEELAARNVNLRQLNNYSDADRIRFGFDYDDLCKYMFGYLDWETRTIKNDALSIWETHMRRQGDYSEYCGTTKKLCVFVTSNPRLAEVALAFRSNRQETRSIQTWRSNHLPVITDIRLTCRLWEPAAQGERISLLYLTANAVAAQHPTPKYYNRIRDLATELEKQVPEYAGICLPAYFDDIVTDAILERTKGQEENLDIATFASTIAELTEWKAKEQEEITNQLKMAHQKTTEDFGAQTKSIIDGAVEKLKDRMGLPGFILRACFWIPAALAVLVGIISWAVTLCVDNWGIMIVAGIVVLLLIGEQITSSIDFTKKILKYVFPWAKNRFIIKIQDSLRPAEKTYEEDIVKNVLEQTELIKKCEDLLESK